MNDNNQGINESTVDKLELDTLPNRLSALRIACVPAVVYFLISDDPMQNFISAVFFGIAGITDYFDGYYARIQKSTTVVGQLLDPLADKFLVISSLIMLMALNRIGPIVVILLICREMAITGLRSIAATEGIVISASNMAKWKTGAQMAAIPALMLHYTYFSINFQLLGTVLTYISLAVSLWSAKDYIVGFFKALRERAHKKREERLAKKAQKRELRKAKKLTRTE